MRRAKYVPSLTAHDCVIASIDPSNATSGFALRGGDMLWSLAAKTAHDRWECVEMAKGYESFFSKPLIFVMEDWGGRVKTTQTAFGMGSARGKWIQEIERTGYREDHIVWMPVSTWRSRIGFGRMADSKAYKRAAVERVRLEMKLDVGHDVAEAFLIDEVSRHSPEVGEMLLTISRSRKRAA